MQIESFNTTPLSSTVPAYLYQQYSDDPDLQALFTAFNTEAQGYLDWFNSTPLSVYTSQAINGPLLDWVGQGVYGIPRPSLSTFSSRNYGAYNTQPFNTMAFNLRRKVASGTAKLANDDIYKRTLTWFTYLGDGRQASIQWLRRRVARFLYGVNGSDVTADKFAQIGITQPASSFAGPYNTTAFNTVAYNARKARKSRAAHALNIIIPPGQISQQFQTLLNAGYLSLPFQVRFTVTIA